MNKYESIIITSPLEKNEITRIIEKIQNLIENNGKLESIEDFGQKKLAYEIRKNKEGYYVGFNFKSKAEFIYELERVYRITDEIIKFIVIKRNN